jgi:hypothetical protein
MLRVTLLLSLVCVPLCGCTLDEVVKNGTKGYSDSNDADMHDSWDVVRKEGRGGDPVEHEWDKLTPIVSSPQAQAIEKNLGYGY